MTYSSPGLTQQITFVRERDSDSEISLEMDIFPDHVREMVDIDHKIVEPGTLQLRRDMVEKRFPSDRYKSLGHSVRQWPEPCSEAGSKDHRLHLEDFFNVQFPVGHRDLYVILFRQAGSQVLCTVDGPMLATCAAEADLHMGKLPLHEALDMVLNHSVDIVEELCDSPVILEELDHFLVQAGKLTVVLELPRVIDGSAVKDETTSVARTIDRDPFLVGETEYADLQPFVLDDVVELRHRGELGENAVEIGIGIERLLEQASKVA